MAELQVGIRADVKDAKRVVKSLDEIKRAAGQSSASLSAAAKTAKTASTSYKVTSGSALQLAGATDLTSAANVALANTLRATAASATKTATAEAAAAAATTELSLASRAASAAQGALARAATVTTGAMARLRATMTGMFVGPTAGLKRFLTQMRTAAGSVAGLSTAAAGLGAVFAVGIGVGIKNAVKFEKTLSRIEGLVGVAASEVESFKKPILEIGKATAKGPNELAEALFFITSAGFKGKEALSVLEASAKAAAAGLGETKQVADAVTSAVNAYGIENLSAAQSTDILVATVREGKAEADSIAGALGQVLPAASELGVEFEELGGTIAALTRIGLGADQGATALGATLAAIQKPGEDAKKALEEAGTSASELRRKVRDDGLLVALQDLQARFGDNEEALTRVFPNIRALRAILPLVGKNAGDVADIFERVANATGSTDKAFDAFTQTSAFTMEQAMVAINQALQKMGEDLIPAAAKALVGLSKAVTAIVDATENAGGFWAEFFGESDDPYKQAIDRLAEINKGIELYESRTSKLGQLGLEIGGIDFGGVELSGTYEENLAKLREARDTWEEIVRLNKAEQEQLKRNADILEEIIVSTKTRTGSLIPEVVIDQDMLKKGQEAFKELNMEADFLARELENLQTLGQEGIGLAEDFYTTEEIMRQLQGQMGITRGEIEALLKRKRDLQEQVDDINEAFQRQATATQFLKDLREDTANLAEQFSMIREGGSLIETDTLQQARQIFADLGADSGETVESIHQALLAQEAWNAALKAMDPTPLADIKTYVETLRDQRAIATTAEDVERLDRALKALGDNAIEEVAAKYGVSADEIDFTSVEEKLRQAEIDLREAWKLSRVIDPDNDPEFQATLDKIKEKITGVSDIMKTFGEEAAKNLQNSFSDFLFDPFSEGLDGMARKFGETLRRLAADILANQILTSFFKSLAGAGGGIGSFGTAALGALGGSFADGGDFSGGKPILVGERGPEVITPRQSGTVIPNEMLQPQQAAAPEVNVAPAPVIVLDDPAKIGRALSTDQNTQRALVDAIATKKGAINQALS